MAIAVRGIDQDICLYRDIPLSYCPVIMGWPVSANAGRRREIPGSDTTAPLARQRHINLSWGFREVKVGRQNN